MLRITNLAFGFRHRPLFDAVDLSVQPGELVHLAGPNGAGKSTFMAIVAGLLRPTRGAVEYWPGSHAAVAAPDRRRFLEYLLAEANGLYGKMDALGNLRYWAALRGRSETAATLRTALAAWGLDHPLLHQGFAVEKYSTGMRRRLALARVTASGAPAWLLDEPVSGLDADGQTIFTAAVRRHLADGGLIVAISHDLMPFAGLVTRTLRLGPDGGRDA